MKIGSLTPEQIAYIEEQAQSQSVNEIAEHLNVKVNRVISVIQKKRNVLKQDGERRRDNQIMAELVSRPFYSGLKKQFSATELDYFNQEWISTVKQFNSDLLPTEETELKDLLILEIMKDQALAQNMQLKSRRETLLKSLSRVEATMVNGVFDRDTQNLLNQIKSEIDRCEQKMNVNLENFKTLTNKSTESRKALAASRSQRITKIQNAKTNFTEWLRAIQDHETRKIIGKEMQTMKLAMENETGRLGEFHNFADGKPEIPLLSSETLADKDLDQYE